jgi:Transposase DDE domain group 1
MRSHQLRLWFAAMAYVLIEAIGLGPIPRRDVGKADGRRIGLKTTRLAQATAGTIRLRLLELGALVRVSARRVTIKMAAGHPWQRDWVVAYAALIAAAR